MSYIPIIDNGSGEMQPAKTIEIRIARKRESILASMAELERRKETCPDFQVEMEALRSALARLTGGKGLLGHFERNT